VSKTLYIDDLLQAWGQTPPARPRDAAEAWVREEARAPRPGANARWSHQPADRDTLTPRADQFRTEPLRVRRRAPGRVADRFAALSESWRRDTLLESSVTRMAMHKAYQQIIGLGMAAVPFILSELEREPNYWFWALTSITGEDPAAGEDTLEGATERWLEWGKDRGLSG
jgi:hypothetical protein